MFLDGLGLGAELSKQLTAAGHKVLGVNSGTEYEQLSPSSYVVRPGAREDYDQLLTDILRDGHRPARILHLWPVTDPSTSRPLEQTLDLNFYSLLALAQALGDQDSGPVEIACISNGLQSVSGEAVVEPARATLLGPIKVIPKEFPGTLCRSVDLGRDIQDIDRAASDIIAELSLPVADSCVCYRNSVRWVESFEAASLRRQPNARLKEKGVYLITGGMGGIGLVLAEHLARTVHARLVLVGRTQLPAMSQWEALLKEDGKGIHAQRIRKLQKIHSLGGEVLTISADVTDPVQIENTLRIARQRFGAIDGVIHAAGLIEDGPLQVKTRESAARVLAPKIHGTLALQKALASDKLDFLLLFSSISSLQPPAGQVDYAAANAFLDAFALSQTGQPVTSINWGLWADVGMGARTVGGNHPILGRRIVQTPNEVVYSLQFSHQDNWLLAEHRFKNGQIGLEDDFFDLGGHSLLAVRLFSKIKKRYQVDLGLSTLFEARTVRQVAAVIKKAGTLGKVEATAPTESVLVRQQRTPSPVGGHIEGALSEWWRELLGVEQVGLDDDFFDLGGHSLLAVRLFSKVKKTFQLNLGLSTLFEARTIRQLAAVIRKAGTPGSAEPNTSGALITVQNQGSRWKEWFHKHGKDNTR